MSESNFTMAERSEKSFTEARKLIKSAKEIINNPESNQKAKLAATYKLNEGLVTLRKAMKQYEQARRAKPRGTFYKG